MLASMLKKLKKRMRRVRAYLRKNAQNLSVTKRRLAKAKRLRDEIRAKRQMVLKHLDRERRRPKPNEALIIELAAEAEALHAEAEGLREIIHRRRARRKEIEANRKRALRRKDKIRRKLKQVRAQRQPSLSRLKINRTPGDPHWGGAGDLIRKFCDPFMRRRGLPLGSWKRTPAHNAAIGGSPTSEHLTTRAYSAARDYPTYSGEDDARALAQALGIKSWRPNSYERHTIVVDGTRLSVQILWGAQIRHADHIHVGATAV